MVAEGGVARQSSTGEWQAIGQRCSERLLQWEGCAVGKGDRN